MASVVATIQDLTALEELERLRAEFLAMVSHELRTPLTSIKGSAATVLGVSSTLGPAEMLQFFRIIRPAGRPHERSDRRPPGRGPHRVGDAVGQSRIGGDVRRGGPGQERLSERRGQSHHPDRPAAGPAQGHGGSPAHRPGPGQPAVQRGPALARGVHHQGERRA